MRIHYNYQNITKPAYRSTTHRAGRREVRILIVRPVEGINNKKGIEKKEDINYNTCHY
jgi:hypothetical protein